MTLEGMRQMNHGHVSVGRLSEASVRGAIVQGGECTDTAMNTCSLDGFGEFGKICQDGAECRPVQMPHECPTHVASLKTPV